jgi:hypothetical protein
MKQIPTQTDGLTSLAAADFNQIPLETQTIITSSGQALDGNFTNQASRAIIDLGMNAGFYTDSGTANNIVLSNSNNPDPTSLRDGIKVIFKSAATNTGATTINLSGLGAKSLLKENGSNLSSGDIIANNRYECIYSSSGDSFTLLNTFKGSIIQNVIATSSTPFTITNQVPTDDTIPQITEGDQILSANITPKSLSNILEIECYAEILFSQSSRTGGVLSLFSNLSNDAISSSYFTNFQISSGGNYYIKSFVNVSSLSSTTFSIRIGVDPATGGTLYVNSSVTGSRFLGGARKSHIYIKEISG